MKKIIVDLDDTICSTLNRDFENSTPNKELIAKVNYFYEKGWEVVILTARGQLSCHGDLQLREDKYRKQIETWLKANKVKYTRLSFDKELADYYIDDRSLSPKGFCDLEVEELKGWSGAEVQRHGNRVYKTHYSIHSQVQWYQIAKKAGFNVPRIYSVVGDTLEMEYIPGKLGNLSPLEIYTVCKLLFRKIPVGGEIENPPLNHNINCGWTFDTYLSYISKHCTIDLFKDFLQNLKESDHSYFNYERSFCHGDFSLQNIICSTVDDKVYLIDPVYIPNVYSSWLLDVSKALYSFKLFRTEPEYLELLELASADFPREELLKLEAIHWMRVYKYAPQDMKSQILEEFKKCSKI